MIGAADLIEVLRELQVVKIISFSHSREIAHQRLKQCLQKMNSNDSVEDTNAKLADECRDWQKQLSENEDSLVHLQYQFFESSLKYLIECRDRMIDDEMRFGKEIFLSSTGE